jgi:hypothetical protein
VLGVAAAACIFAAGMQPASHAAADVFQQTVNYVFTGTVTPKAPVEIVDRKACIVVMRDPKYDRFIRYYLRRFQMDTALFAKKYSGRQPYYELDVKGGNVILEYLSSDRKTVAQRYRSAKISLPGDIEQTQRALKIIFDQYCPREKPQAPF